MTTEDLISGDRFAKYIGVELKECREGYALASLDVKDIHLNAGGVCQGGVIFTLADFAFAAAVNSHGVLTLSVSSNITFFRSESHGTLFARAQELVDHHRMPYCEVRVKNEKDELVAVFTGTGYRKG